MAEDGAHWMSSLLLLYTSCASEILYLVSLELFIPSDIGLTTTSTCHHTLVSVFSAMQHNWGHDDKVNGHVVCCMRRPNVGCSLMRVTSVLVSDLVR